MKHTFTKCMSLALLWVMAASAWALDKVNGVYQIGTTQDLKDFIALVNGGEKYANAVLTADIDYSEGTEVITYFAGTLDGQRHTITVGFNNQPHNFNALIYKHYGRVVNLCIEGTIITNQKHASGLSHICGGYIGQCVSKVNIVSSVSGDGTHAGLAAEIRIGALMENSAFYGSFTGANTTNCGGIAGWVDQYCAIRNCLVVADYNHNVTSGTGPIMRHEVSCPGQSNNYFKIENTGYTKEAQSTKVTAAEIESGEVVVKLNAGNEETVWMQEEGQLPMPWAREGSPIKTFELSTAADVQAFAQKINAFQNWHNAKLMGDIDMAGAEFDMIGRDESSFKGDFDGQGHWIKNLVIDRTGEDNVGFFRSIAAESRIHDLLFDENCMFKGKNHIGPIGHSTGAEKLYIYNVGNLGTVTSDGTSGDAGVGGIIGNANGGSEAYIDRCFSTCNVTGTSAALISGWQGTNLGMVSNCWASGATSAGNAADKTLFRCGGAAADVMSNCFSVNGTQGTNFKAEEVANGGLTFKINQKAGEGKWFQDLSKDAMPQLYGEKLVYQVGTLSCDGTPKPDFYYSNEDLGSTQDEHQMNPETGLCDVCGQMPQDEDGYYMIGGADALLKFAEMVNGGKLDAKAKFTADIDLAGKTWVPMGDDTHMFTGTIDGQQHIISNLVYEDLETGKPAGFVGTATTGAVFKNLIFDETCSFKAASKYIGTFAGHTTASGVVVFDGCGTAATLEGTANIKDGGLAGITGNANAGSILHIDNCWVAGKLTGQNDVAAISAWCGNVGAWVKNCWAVADLNKYQDAAHYLARCGASFTVENCFTTVGTQGTLLPEDITVEDCATGKLCYALNGDQAVIRWYQNLGEGADKYPVAWADHKRVYANGKVRCDGTPEEGSEVTYANSQTSEKPDHTDEDHNGFCDVCENIIKDFIVPVEGFYGLGSEEDLIWFAAMVEISENQLNARLTEDITVSSAFQGIGVKKYYAGEFDGQDYTISGISINVDVADAGFIRTAAPGMYLHNIILEGSVRTTGASAGAVGGSQGTGDIKFANVISALNVEALGSNAGGLFGCNHGSSAVLTFNNCGVTGNIVSGTEGGLIAGWSAKNTVVSNCWSKATIEGPQVGREFIRYSDGLTLTNCYAVGTEQVTTIEEADVASGKLTWLLNGESFMNVTWYQTLGEDEYPTWVAGHDIVYKRGDNYDSFTPSDAEEVAAFCQNVVNDLEEEMSTIVAQKSLVATFLEELQSLKEITTYDNFCKAYNQLSVSKAKVDNSAKKYAAYTQTCEDVIAFLEENPFACKERELLEKYLNEKVEPNTEFVNGSYPYIVDVCELNDDQLTAEIDFVLNLKAEAVKHGYVPGSEITDMIVNPNFSDSFNGWTTSFEGTHLKTATVKNVGSAVEAWNCTFDVHQKVEELQPGLYEVRVSGAYRPYGDYTSNFYAAQLYANGKAIFLMNEGENYLPKADAVDGVNCHLSGEGGLDYNYIYGVADGYVPRGPEGCTYHFADGRYVNSVVAEVGEDGVLTFGVKNPGSGQANDWTGFSNFRLFYLGTADQATDGLDRTMTGYKERANVVLSLIPGTTKAEAIKYPNCEAALQEELAELATTEPANNEEKVQQFAQYTELFGKILESRKAYAKMIEVAENAFETASNMQIYGLISLDDVAEFNTLLDEAWTDFEDGEINAEQALAYIQKCDLSKFYPAKDEDAYLLATAKDVQMFSFMVNSGMFTINAKLTADVDFLDVTMLPIGYDANKPTEASDAVYFKGVFDGQGHHISNLVIDMPEAVGVGLFGTLENGATIKNLVLESTCSITGKDRAGVAGRSSQAGDVYFSCVGNEGSVFAAIAPAGILGNANSSNIAHFENCYSTGTISASDKNAAQICGWFGAVGGTITNCWSTATITGYDNLNTVFFRTGGSPVSTNNYSTSGNDTQAKLVTEEQFASGEITYNLNNGAEENVIWYQLISEDAHPVFDAARGIVKKDAEGKFYTDPATGIEDIEAQAGHKVANGIYNLQGQRLSKMQRGLNIVDGKVVLVK